MYEPAGEYRTKNSALLKSFIDYCLAHPTERFWQALRNWSAYNFILVADSIKFSGEEVKYPGLKDTFYFEGESHVR